MKILLRRFRQDTEDLRLAYDKLVQDGGLADIRKLRKNLALDAQKEILRSSDDLEITETLSFLRQRELAYFFSSKLVSMLASPKSRNKQVRIVVPAGWLTRIIELRSFAKAFKNNRAKLFNIRMALFIRSLLKITSYTLKALFLKTSKIRINSTQVFIIGHISDTHQNSKINHFDFASWFAKEINREVSAYFLLERQFAPFLIKSVTFKSFIVCIGSTFSRIYRIRKNGVSFFDSLSMIDQIFMYYICTRLDGHRYQVLFSESSGGIRPLWTYSLERAGVEVGMVNFSNSATPSLDTDFTEIDPPIILYNWKRYFCCTQRQFELIKRYSLSGEQCELAGIGVPWFKDSALFSTRDNVPYIAVFDYDSYASHFGYSTLNDLGYGQSSINEKFMLPILVAAQKYGIKVVHKPKRDTTSHVASSSSSILIEKFLKFENYVRLDSNCSPIRIISEANGVISMPPTTTGLIASQMGKESAFFDFTGRIIPTDPALEGVHLMKNASELDEWIRKIL